MNKNKTLIVETKTHGKITVLVERYNPLTKVYYWTGLNEHSSLKGASKSINEAEMVRETVKVEHPEYGTVEVVLKINQDTGKYRIENLGIEGDAMVTMADLDPADKRIIRKLVKDKKG